MAEYAVRTTSQNIDTDTVKASLSAMGDIYQMPFIYRLAMEGRVFICGQGIESTTVDGEAAIDDTTPTYLLRAPEQGLLVIPFWIRIQLTTEGGAAPDVWIAYINNGTDTNPALTAGTDVVTLNVLGGARPGNNQATCQTGATLGAITDAQNICIFENASMQDNLLSAPTNSDLGVGNLTTEKHLPLYPNIPLILNRGTALAVYTATGTSDSKWDCQICWAELPATVLPSSMQ